MRLKAVNIILFVFICSDLFGQFAGDSLYHHEQLNESKSLEESEWNKVIENTTFDEEKIEKQKEEDNEQVAEVDEESDNWWESLAPIIKIIAVLFLVVIVGYIIYLLTRVEANKKFKIDTNPIMNLDDIEEHLLETELERFLRTAIEAKDYRLAIRIYFLMILQKLTELNWINYKKEKTNFSYLLEMKSRRKYEDFRNLTFAFEYAWYGDVIPDEDMFTKLKTGYESFLSTLDRD